MPNLKEYQISQQKHDVEHHKDIMESPKQLQIEHCTFHIMKIAGKLGDYCEKKHHNESSGSDELSERIADLQIFTLKLANLWGLDLDKIYTARVALVEERHKP